MPYEDLLKDQSIKSFSPTSREITGLIEIAHVRLRELRQGEFAPDILYQLSYDVARAAAQALMASEGYRPRGGGGQHKVIFEFLEEVDGGRWTREAGHFDQARMKRNRALYEEAGLITPEESERLLEIAGDFLGDVEARIRESRSRGHEGT